MNILDNELVRKYFSPPLQHIDIEKKMYIALNILQAMQQPIKKGERMLAAFPKEITEETASRDIEAGNYPRSYLRLPDSFQTKEEGQRKCGCGLTWATIHRFDGPCEVISAADPVEKKIKDLQFEWASEVGMDSRFITEPPYPARAERDEAMSESILMREIQLAASQRGWRLFRNNVGLGWVGQPCSRCQTFMRRQRFGLCVGSSDLIGWQPGGRFTAREIKTSRGITSAEQASFLKQVLKDGGDAAVIRSVDEL